MRSSLETPIWPAIFRRLWDVGAMATDDIEALAELPWTRRSLQPREDVRVEGKLAIIASGLLARYRDFHGGRQLVALLLPGDVCDFQFLTGKEHGAGLSVMVRTTILEVSTPHLMPILERHPKIVTTLLQNFGQDSAVAEELLISLGNRNALERLAHLLCEVHFRLDRMQLVRDGAFSMGLTQAELGEYLGLSAVHVNRTLQELRRRGLVQSAGGTVRMLSLETLQALGGFSPAYLRPGTEPLEQRLDG